MWSYLLFALTIAIVSEVDSGGVPAYPGGYAYGLPPGSVPYPGRGPYTPPSATDYGYGYGYQKPPKQPVQPQPQINVTGVPGNGGTRLPDGGGQPRNGGTQLPDGGGQPRNGGTQLPDGGGQPGNGVVHPAPQPQPGTDGQYKPKTAFPFPNGFIPSGGKPPGPQFPGWQGGYYPQWNGAGQKPPKPLVLPQPQPPTQNFTRPTNGDGQVQPQYPYWQSKPKPPFTGGPYPPVPGWHYPQQPQPGFGQFPPYPSFVQQKPPKPAFLPTANVTGGPYLPLPPPFTGAPPQPWWSPRPGTQQPQPYWPYGGPTGYGQPPQVGTGTAPGYRPPYLSGTYPGGGGETSQPSGVKPPKGSYPWGSFPQAGTNGYGQSGIRYPTGAGQYYPGYSPQYQYPGGGLQYHGGGYIKDKSGGSPYG